tara:strand:+ start:2819 stop:3583 length:765 start_codon:yes stop_codon:yes gene_type:complete
MNYSNQKNKVKKLVDHLNRFCFDSKNIEKLDLLSNKEIKNKTIKNLTKNSQNSKDEKKIDFFIPHQQDSIFWCWYIFKHGIKEYNIIRNKYFIIEKNTKIDWIPILRKNKVLVKQLKFNFSSLENNLVNEKKMNIKAFEIICFINNIDFCIIKNKMIYKNCNDKENTILLKYYPKQKKYGIFVDQESISEKIKLLEKTLFQVNNIEKPLKGISSYKAKDLQDIAKQLEISLIQKITGKNKTKKILYSEIQELLV